MAFFTKYNCPNNKCVFLQTIKKFDLNVFNTHKAFDLIKTEDIKEHYLNLLKRRSRFRDKEQTFNNFSYRMIIRKFWIDYHNVPREKKLLEAKQLSKSIVITDTNNITHKLQFKNEKHFQDFFITLSTEINK